MTIKVSVLGLIFAANRLHLAATELTALTAPAFAQPLATDGTSVGAAARLDAASTALLASTVAHVASLEEAAGHLMLIAAKFGTTEEINKAHLDWLSIQAAGLDEQTLATLSPVPPLAPNVRIPLPPVPAVEGEVFSQQVNNGSASRAEAFNTAATNIGSVTDEVATTVRSVAAQVPEYWESPTGTAALAGRLNEHVSALNTISDRWYELAGQSRKHADDYSQTVSATPKPQEFTEVRDRLNRAIAAKDPIGASQASTDLGMLNGRATAEAGRYAGVTEASTGLGGPSAPTQGAPGAGAPAATGAGAGAGAPAQAAGAVGGQGQQLAKTGATEAAAQAGQTGQGADQLAQMLPQALQSIGGMAGGMAGMAGQIPQQLMQSGQGLMQAAQQGLGGLMGKNPSEAELAKKMDALKTDDLAKGAGGGGAGGGGGGVGDTHPAGSLGPPVIPTASHTPPAMPSGAAPPPATPTPAGGTAMGGMPMGMPMSSMMGHGAQGGGGADGPDKVAADKKIVTPPQAHTEPVTGRVADRTAAAAEASRARADSDSDSDDDPPPRGPIMRRITLAPLNDERQ